MLKEFFVQFTHSVNFLCLFGENIYLPNNDNGALLLFSFIYEVEYAVVVSCFRFFYILTYANHIHIQYILYILLYLHDNNTFATVKHIVCYNCPKHKRSLLNDSFCF